MKKMKKWLILYSIGVMYRNVIIKGVSLTENLIENTKSSISDKYMCSSEEISIHNIILLDD
jgi:hypothetical protein